MHRAMPELWLTGDDYVAARVTNTCAVMHIGNSTRDSRSRIGPEIRAGTSQGNPSSEDARLRGIRCESPRNRKTVPTYVRAAECVATLRISCGRSTCIRQTDRLSARLPDIAPVKPTPSWKMREILKVVLIKERIEDHNRRDLL